MRPMSVTAAEGMRPMSVTAAEGMRPMSVTAAGGLRPMSVTAAGGLRTLPPALRANGRKENYTQNRLFSVHLKSAIPIKNDTITKTIGIMFYNGS